ncbi:MULTISPECIES: hypothetical protein [unclassified Streptomyces]|jgi:hypothetical protein|uniref:hypothetical protein n=1 Tax=unclassified Streptomyces TaxID=2593676 RepID=UPI000BB162C8|nr:MULTISPECIES: hypothetical protein [unclassified Streptomyces]
MATGHRADDLQTRPNLRLPCSRSRCGRRNGWKKNTSQEILPAGEVVRRMTRDADARLARRSSQTAAFTG